MLTLAIGKGFDGPLPEQSNALREHDTELAEQAADLIGQCRSRSDRSGACPMQRKDRLLRLRLDRHKAHVRSTDRLADCFGIGRIGLVALYVRSNELRGNQTHGVSELRESPA